MNGGLSAIVAGGGIAGLASAVSLSQAGWRVTLLERAPEFGEVGAGLAITSNGMTALAALGLDGAVRAAGYLTGAEGIAELSGKWLVRLPDTSQMTTLFGLQRQRLHAVLLSAAQAADGVELVTGAEVTGVSPGNPAGSAAEVTWVSPGGAENTARADLVVAADGVRSAVRGILFPDVRAEYSGSTSWRAVIPDTSFDERFTEVWGPGTEFGALRVSEAEIYWYGYFTHPEGLVFPDELGAAREIFRTWAPWVRAIVDATPAERLMRHDVYFLRAGLPSYVTGRVVFVGDAGHAVLPTTGQGAATALEDAVCLGRMIAAPVRTGGDLGASLAAFDRVRRPRCERIGRTGVMIARYGADVGAGWRQRVRNSVVRALPARLLIRAGEPILRWTAP